MQTFADSLLTNQEIFLFQLIDESNQLIDQQNKEERLEEIVRQVETILENLSFLANTPKYLSYDRGYGRESAAVYPLNSALELRIVQLLLDYGANPNLKSYEPEFLTRDNKKPLQFNALEMACSKRHYQKAMVILTHSKPKIGIDSIERAYYYLFYSSHISSQPVKAKPSALVQKLSETVSLKMAYERLNTLIIKEPNTKEFLANIPEFDRERIAKVQADYNQIKSDISFYNACINRALIYPFWAILLAGDKVNSSSFMMLPRDVHELIITYLCNSTEYSLEQINIQKLRVFKRICISLQDKGFQTNYFFKELFNLNSKNSVGQTIEFIKNIHSDAVMPIRSRPLILRAWLLACESYETNLCDEAEFDKLMKMAEMHAIIKTHIKILTIMAKYNPVLKTYELYKNFEYRISKEDSKLLKALPSYIKSNHNDLDLGPSYEEILSEIKEQLVQPHINLAYQLAEQHHQKFNCQNKPLIDALVQWALKTKPQKDSGFFPSLNEIIKDVSLCIDKLNNNNKIIVDAVINEELGYAVCTMGRK